LIEGWIPELVVSGINHGSNIGDDITYSGTVAAALEAIVLGWPGIAVSQQSNALELDFRLSETFDFKVAADFTAKLVADLDGLPLPKGTLLNVNFPGAAPEGVKVAKLGRRFYTDELAIIDESGPNRKLYQVYGQPHPAGMDELDTDVAAVAAGYVAVTPLHFDLTDHSGVQALADHDLERLLHQPLDQQR
jgi:5'-nucleotidase